MAVPANTVQTFAMVGIREQLSDVITNIDPQDTPGYSMCKKGTAKSRTPEWQRDRDDDPDPANANIEGDAATNDTTSQPERLKNVVQLFDKVVEVSTTAQAVDSAGRGNELKYQMAKKGRALKRDIEARITGNFASVLGAAGTAGQCAGMEAYIVTNVSRGATGASGGYQTGTGLITAATDGTARAATETQLKEVIALAWENGGDPSIIMVGGRMKQKYSGFAGIATQYRENSGKKQATILGAADVYVSDFGEHRIVPSRFQCYGTGRASTRAARLAAPVDANRTVLVLTPDTWKLDYLQPMKQEPLAKLGHSDRRMLSCELTLECSEERANGAVADLNLS